MPDYLTLDGVVIPVRYGGGSELAPDRSGELVTTWYNNTFTSEKAAETKRVWRFITPPLAGDDWLTLRAQLEAGTFMEAGGYAISRGLVPVDPLDPTGPTEPETLTVYATLLDVPHHREGDTDIAYEVTFQLDEV